MRNAVKVRGEGGGGEMGRGERKREGERERKCKYHTKGHGKVVSYQNVDSVGGSSAQLQLEPTSSTQPLSVDYIINSLTFHTHRSMIDGVDIGYRLSLFISRLAYY